MSRRPRVTGSELQSLWAWLALLSDEPKEATTLSRHEDGRTTVVPLHSGETIGPGLLLKILRDCQIEVDDLQRMLNPDQSR